MLFAVYGACVCHLSGVERRLRSSFVEAKEEALNPLRFPEVDRWDLSVASEAGLYAEIRR